MNDNSILLAKKAMVSSFNHTEHIYIDICDDLVAGTLLSQILYWFKPSSNGKMKVRAFHGGEYWLAKSREEWWDEIRITPRQFDYAIKSLLKKGFVEKKIFKFNGIPTVHIRPIAENINKATNEWVRNCAISIEKEATNNENTPILTKCQNGFSQNVKMDFDKSVKSITENTNKDYTESIKVSKVNFTEHQGEENPHMPDVGYFDHVDIHNDFILADALKKMLRSYNIDESMRAYKHPYILLSTFAETYREKKHRKHDEIHYSKLQEYVGRLIKFTPIAVDDNIFDGIPKSHSFSIFDYTEDEIRMMVDDFFNYDFSDADYSLHLFMSNDVLEARFWQIENRHTDIAM